MHYAESQCDVILKLQVEAETASLAYLAAEEMTSQPLSQSWLRGYWSMSSSEGSALLVGGGPWWGWGQHLKHC